MLFISSSIITDSRDLVQKPLMLLKASDVNKLRLQLYEQINAVRFSGEQDDLESFTGSTGITMDLDTVLDIDWIGSAAS